MIIAGIGRFGQIVNRLVRSAGFATVVIDNDLQTVQMMRKFGFRGFFGDPSRPDVLKAAGLADAKILVVAVDDRKASAALVRYARRERPDLHIIARAHDRVHVYELFDAGADDIVREVFDSALRAGRYALENLGMTEYEAAEAEQMFYHHDREALRELAELWKPGVPIADIPEYVARSRELNNDLETALASIIEARNAETVKDPATAATKKKKPTVTKAKTTVAKVPKAKKPTAAPKKEKKTETKVVEEEKPMTTATATVEEKPTTTVEPAAPVVEEVRLKTNVS